MGKHVSYTWQWQAADSKYFLFSPFLIRSVAQLELNYNKLLMAKAVVLHIYFNKTHSTFELPSWTWTMGPTSEV